ncbi:LptF/LptG family permease [Flavisphingopyxis soli]|uniref:LptF/LptG family permease n=1 Tax=Flavisphingopyxis soli TaxID=2601267 RepID=UPI0013757604|nr:LptF/LptG family permease [Sphingorhabdus soli]
MALRLDWYFLRRALKIYGAVCIVMAALLILENTPRLLALIGDTTHPLRILAQMSLALIPEYMAIGTLVGLFLAIALATRSLCLSGEYQIFSAIGRSPARLLVAPMILALATMGVQAGLRFELQPSGEVRLQQLGNDILSGMLGLAVHADQPISLGGGTSLYVDRIDADRQRLLDVILETGNATFYARSADAAYVSEGFVRFRLEHVTAVYPQASGRARSGTFAAIDFVTPMHSSAPITGPARFETKQRGLAGLIAMHRNRNADARAAADKAIAERASYVLACLFFPWLAIALGTPPLRSTSGLGIGAGCIVIVLFIKSVSLAASDLPISPFVAAAVNLGLWATVLYILFAYEQKHGPGWVESWLFALTRRLRSIVRRTASPIGYSKASRAAHG